MNKILNTIQGREKCYRFLQFLEKFLTSSEPISKNQTLYWIIKKISQSIEFTKHINKFGASLEYIENLKNKLKGKIIFYLPLNELFLISSDILNILDTFIDHLIFLCKINVINNNQLLFLNRLSGIIWFLNISKVFGTNIKKYYINNTLTIKEKCKIIQCIFDYIVLLNYSMEEHLIPRWLFGVFGMLSCALSVYTKYLLK